MTLVVFMREDQSCAVYRWNETTMDEIHLHVLRALVADDSARWIFLAAINQTGEVLADKKSYEQWNIPKAQRDALHNELVREELRKLRGAERF